METHTHPLAYNPSLPPSCLLDRKADLFPIIKKKKSVLLVKQHNTWTDHVTNGT